VTLAVLSIIVALGAAFERTGAFILLFVISLSGVLYNARLLPAEGVFSA